MLHKIKNKIVRIILFICAFAVVICSLSFILTACGSNSDESDDKTIVKTTDEEYEDDADSDTKYILNSSSKKFHKPSCRHVDTMKSENKLSSSKTRSELIENGYAPCKTCKP